ncbi:lytic polysaccharide monooxygenase [Solwaraspora sp. WMMB335]|uniref:lytic polysaccharide monooxygenase n=1 Tax=Solwaraspora sp. WMMB335 TaxID=3404118 RepID=UPI003B9269FF
MRRRITLSLLSAGAVLGTLLVATPAQAHGYISYPASRQAMCAQGRVPADCGAIVWEPQSVEGPKGQRTCHGGVARFAILNDTSVNWPTTQVGNSVTFTWTLTARHSTSTWEYYIGGSRIAVFDDGGRQPNATVSHQVNLGGRSGRQTVLAIWNIADTANAFYSCVDVQIGGGGGPAPTTAPPPPPTTAPPTTPAPTSPPGQPGGTWTPGTTYQVGATVTYGGASYRCRQAHTALVGWEPPNVPALWQRL